MALIIAFAFFIAMMVQCLACGLPLLIALVGGLAAFTAVGRIKGFKIKDVLMMALRGVRDSLIVLEIIIMIGFIMAIWRASGTITFFVYYGVKIVEPPIFVLLAYVMSCLLTYVLGTSFSVSGTLGVIFMALAKSGGVDPLVVAGAVMSGIYFGDRCSPASSSAILVANVTGTDLMDNVKTMHKTGLIALIISLILYTVLSFANPLHEVDKTIMDAMSSEFNLSVVVLLPALFILVLPMLKLDIRWAFAASIVSGFILMITIQGMDIADALITCITGFVPEDESLRNIMGGGGAVSMLEVCGIIMLSCSYSGIFRETDMLSEFQEKIDKAMTKTGRYLMTFILSIAACAVFCSQTLAIMLCNDFMSKPYLATGGTRKELAIDIENSAIMIAAFIPWNIACSAALEMMDVGVGALRYSYLLFLIPIVYIFTKKLWFNDKVVRKLED